MEQAPKKQNNEDLLTYYLHRQDAKKRCLCGNQKTDYFPLPHSVFMIRGRWKMFSSQSLIISDIKIL